MKLNHIMYKVKLSDCSWHSLWIITPYIYLFHLCGFYRALCKPKKKKLCLTVISLVLSYCLVILMLPEGRAGPCRSSRHLAKWDPVVQTSAWQKQVWALVLAMPVFYMTPDSLQNKNSFSWCALLS